MASELQTIKEQTPEDALAELLIKTHGKTLIYSIPSAQNGKLVHCVLASMPND